ncbi:hypothetical protein ABT294_39620 [Nonomuraea sp. NPDC000554]|uniref:hypothetical protein n=1 Tax=Nonomuraea sp. NPDC000554 TaxID=3154259 RepID=UPI0033207595
MRPSEPAREPADDIAIPAAELLARLDPMPYPQRMRELALHARRLAGTSQLSALLGDLRSRGGYGRRTALHVAMAARDLGFVEEILAGPDMGLRRAALRAVRTLPVPDPAVAAALQDAPTELRLALYRTLVHARRQRWRSNCCTTSTTGGGIARPPRCSRPAGARPSRSGCREWLTR